MLAAVGAFVWHQLQTNDHNDGFITPQQYQAVTFDEPRPSIIHHLGKPLLAARTYPLAPSDDSIDLGQPPSGSLCDYYGEADTIQDPGEMRFCYRGDRLVEKASYDIEVDAPQEICVWHSSSRAAACRSPKP